MKSKNIALGILAGAAVVSAAAFFLMRRQRNNESRSEDQSAMMSRGERLAVKARHKAQHHFAQAATTKANL
jgi:gas vesicle protein